MVITPSEPWSIHEDSTGEFALMPDAAPDNDVLFWEDVYPIDPQQARTRSAADRQRTARVAPAQPRGFTSQRRARARSAAACPPRSST